MKKLALAAVAAFALVVPAAPAGAAPDCRDTNTCRYFEIVDQALCLGNMDCQRVAGVRD
jgi:hypothetical protein